MSRRTAFRALAFGVSLIALLPLTGCRNEPAAPVVASLPTVRMPIGNGVFTLEVADDDAERQQGLMHRESMPPDRGMIFVFQREQPLGFWMKNTLIPLDILYLDSQGRVVTIATMKPLDETAVPSRVPARYAVELTAGTARRVDVRVGDLLAIPPELRSPEHAR